MTTEQGEEIITTREWREIIYGAVNSAMPAILIFLGAFTTGEITLKAVVLAFIVSSIAFVTQFWDYWKTKERDFCASSTKLFKFV